MSSFLNEVLGQQADRIPGAEVWSGVINKTATTVTERLRVIIPGYPNAVPLELPVGCRWTPRVEPHDYDVSETGESSHLITAARIVYPQKGDPCLVAFDDHDSPWIVCYWPAAYD